MHKQHLISFPRHLPSFLWLSCELVVVVEQQAEGSGISGNALWAEPYSPEFLAMTPDETLDLARQTSVWRLLMSFRTFFFPGRTCKTKCIIKLLLNTGQGGDETQTTFMHLTNLYISSAHQQWSQLRCPWQGVLEVGARRKAHWTCPQECLESGWASQGRTVDWETWDLCRKMLPPSCWGNWPSRPCPSRHCSYWRGLWNIHKGNSSVGEKHFSHIKNIQLEDIWGKEIDVTLKK